MRIEIFAGEVQMSTQQSPTGATATSTVETLHHSTTIHSFPVEILTEITRFLHPTHLTSWGTVSKLLNAVSTRQLYRTIVLQTLTAVIRCCKTLLSNPLAALSVRSFTAVPPQAFEYVFCLRIMQGGVPDFFIPQG